MRFKLGNKDILRSLYGNVKPSILKFASPLKTHEDGKAHGDDENLNWEYPEGEDANIRTYEEERLSYEEAGVDPVEAQRYWDENPELYKEYLESKKRTQKREDTSKEIIDFDPGSFNWDNFSKRINDREGKKFTGEGIRAYFDKVGYDKFNTYIKDNYPYMMTGPKRRKIIGEGKTDFKGVG